ncbi:hypothetical protein PAHAL_1G085400 [Panicum hallii]|uniref:Uncharacterized protein n=1 Tax=Panicum hallii TaxID=206008 RepID=A0A2T8KUK1_9POAL|nr:hypothetical protein PAHAL_1G085400 [Panicum hallii]
MDAKVMTAILFAMFLASLVSSVECDGDSVVRFAGGHRRQWDNSENMSEGSKIKLRLCFRQFLRRPLLKTCYCCQTLSKFPCYWEQHRVVRPSSPQPHQDLFEF